MTEAERMACEDPMRTLDFICEHASSRKLRLFACIFFRCIYSPTDSRIKIVGVGERHADGQASEDEVRDAAASALTIHQGASQAVWLVVSTNVNQAIRSVFSHEFAFDYNLKQVTRFHEPLKEIFGNPFRPATFAPAWRTETVVALASRCTSRGTSARCPSSRMHSRTRGATTTTS